MNALHAMVWLLALQSVGESARFMLSHLSLLFVPVVLASLLISLGFKLFA